MERLDYELDREPDMKPDWWDLPPLEYQAQMKEWITEQEKWLDDFEAWLNSDHEPVELPY